MTILLFLVGKREEQFKGATSFLVLLSVLSVTKLLYRIEWWKGKKSKVIEKETDGYTVGHQSFKSVFSLLQEIAKRVIK